MFLLFACGVTDDFGADVDLAKEQAVLSQINDETIVSFDKATEIADLFFSELTASDVSTRSTQRGAVSVESLKESGRPLMYVINYANGGFVIVGATKNYYPILAYSDENSFEIAPEMGGASFWLEETKDAINMSDAFSDDVKTEMRSLWNSYEYEAVDVVSSWETQGAQTRSSLISGQEACWLRSEELTAQYWNEGWVFYPLSNVQSIFADAGYSDLYNDLVYSAAFNGSPLDCSVIGIKRGTQTNQVGPLLSTAWHQDSPFNDLVPNGHAAGCGAIAVAQLAKYYEYPGSFNWNGYRFNWSSIDEDYENNLGDHDALVRLIGNTVNMHYASYGSWATPNAMENGIRFLGYNVTRSNHDHNAVRSQLLNYRRPVIMGGNANNIPLPSPLDFIGQSHYWVCDGAQDRTVDQIKYFTEWQPNGNGVFYPGWHSIEHPGQVGGIGYLYFHMKWGWEDGSCDGWFAFNDVNSGNGNFRYARQDFYITRP